jgi:hypothetical protein
MKITTGTCYFPSTAHARNYYSQQHPYAMPKELALLVEHKKDTKEIQIGNPPLKDGQEKRLIDNRWHICE